MIKKSWILQPKHRPMHRSALCPRVSWSLQTASSGKKFPHSTHPAGHWTTHCTNLPLFVLTLATCSSFALDHRLRLCARHVTPNAPLRGKGKTGKGKTGKGNAPPLKRKTPGTPAPPDNAQLDLVKSHGNKTFCIRWNKGACTNKQCKYLHACAFPSAKRGTMREGIIPHVSIAILRSLRRPELRSRPQPGEHGCSNTTPRHCTAHLHRRLLMHCLRWIKTATTSQHHTKHRTPQQRQTSLNLHSQRRQPQKIRTWTATPSPRNSPRIYLFPHAFLSFGPGKLQHRHKSTPCTFLHRPPLGSSPA